jgi:mono/diheme cytochrome c family protein
MKIKLFILIGIGSLIISACGAKTVQPATINHNDDNGHMADTHMNNMLHMHTDPPTEFADLTNPFTDDHDTVAAGAELFSTYCATCHGETGAGDGPASEGLSPKPANLADGMMINMLSDGYLFWRISRGGAIEPFNSAMPAWEASFTEEQRWQLVTFVRSLADESGEHMSTHADSH